MKLSIITINFNNCAGLIKTLNSVIQQFNKDFEYIVIDGGSTDGSVDVLKQHSKYFAHWVSEPDKGIYNAMNKGILAANGEYLLFMNSGDRFTDQFVVEKIINKLVNEDIIYGNGILEIRDQELIKVEIPEKLELDYFVNSSLFHPASFIKKQLFKTYGMYNENNKIVSDWEFFIKTLLVNNTSSRKINHYIAIAEGNGVSRDKANRQLLKEEISTVLNRYFFPVVIDLMYKHKRLKEELQTLKNEQNKSIFHRLGILIQKWKKKN